MMKNIIIILMWRDASPKLTDSDQQELTGLVKRQSSPSANSNLLHGLVISVGKLRDATANRGSGL